jgi:glycosyltransferase involved in cell wall biosynthesis
MRCCLTFVYPSLYEGFGLPVLEALALGAAVITSNVSSLPEVAGDAALLIDPLNVDAIAAGIARVAGDSAFAAALRSGGPVQAARFSWERVAEAHRRIYAGDPTEPPATQADAAETTR